MTRPMMVRPVHPPPPPLPLLTKVAYSFGHVLNDLSISIWFSFTILYFQPRLTGCLPGMLLLIGQFADAFSSQLIGIYADGLFCGWPFNRFGRRKSLHAMGAIGSSAAVAFLYDRCYLGEDAPEWLQFVYYSVLVVLFQASWAASQVTHIALINDLTPLQSERITLNSYRQVARMIASTLVYIISLNTIKSDGTLIGESLPDPDNLTLRDGLVVSEPTAPTELVSFTLLTYAIVAIGGIFTILFYLLVNEPEARPTLQVTPRRPTLETAENGIAPNGPAVANGVAASKINPKRLEDGLTGGPPHHLPPIQEDDANSSKRSSLVTIPPPPQPSRRVKLGKPNNRAWFGSAGFWLIGSTYTLARIFCNVSQVYMTLYLMHYLLLPNEAFSWVPFTVNLSSLLVSFAIEWISKSWGSRISLFCGAAVGLLSAAWILLGEGGIFFVAGGIGVAGTAMLLSSLGLISDLIGITNMDSNIFVFSTISFFDKVINGVIIVSLDIIKPLPLFGQQMPYYKLIMVIVTGLPPLLVLLLLLAIWPTRYGRREETSPVMVLSNGSSDDTIQESATE